MPVGIQGDEGAAEIEMRGWLQNAGPARAPIRVCRIDRGGIGDRDGDLAAASRGGRGGLDGVARPEAPHYARGPCEHREGRRLLDRRPAQKFLIEGGTRRRALDVEQDEIDIEHADLLLGAAMLHEAAVRFWQY